MCFPPDIITRFLDAKARPCAQILNFSHHSRQVAAGQAGPLDKRVKVVCFFHGEVQRLDHVTELTHWPLSIHNRKLGPRGKQLYLPIRISDGNYVSLKEAIWLQCCLIIEK